MLQRCYVADAMAPDEVAFLVRLGTLVAFLLVSLIVVLVVWDHSRDRRLDQAWEEARHRLDGRFDAKAGPWLAHTRKLTATVRGVAVSMTNMALRAQVDAASGSSLSLKPKVPLPKTMAKAMGLQGIVTGDAEFDDSFLLQSNDEDLAQAWLTTDVRAEVLTAKGYSFELAQGRLTVTADARRVPEEDHAVLEAAVRATGALAARGKELQAWWRQVAEEGETSLQQRDDGGWRIEIDKSDVPLQVDPRTERECGGTLTRVAAPIVDASPERFELGRVAGAVEDLKVVDADRVDGLPDDYVLHSSEPSRTSRRFSSEVQQRIARLQPQRIVAANGEVRIDVTDVEDDEERLHEALELAAALAVHQDRSAYRG